MVTRTSSPPFGLGLCLLGFGFHGLHLYLALTHWLDALMLLSDVLGDWHAGPMLRAAGDNGGVPIDSGPQTRSQRRATPVLVNRHGGRDAASRETATTARSTDHLVALKNDDSLAG